MSYPKHRDNSAAHVIKGLTEALLICAALVLSVLALIDPKLFNGIDLLAVLCWLGFIALASKGEK